MEADRTPQAESRVRLGVRVRIFTSAARLPGGHERQQRENERYRHDRVYSPVKGAVIAIVLLLLVLAGCATTPDAPLAADRTRATAEYLTAPDPPIPLLNDRAETRQALTKLEAENQTLHERLRDLQTEMDDVRREIGRLATEARAAREAASVLAPAPDAAMAATPPPAPVAAERLYAEALSLFRARRYPETAQQLGELVERFPSHPLVPKAQYWMGQAHYSERDYAQAIMQFEKAVELAGGEPAAPDALLMIAYSYRNLGDVGNARTAVRRLLERYPESEAAHEGRHLLNMLR